VNDSREPPDSSRWPMRPGRCSCEHADMPTALACSASPDLFFAELPADVTRAKALCRDCPVRAACLADALDRGEPWGVWGANCSSTV